MTTNAPKIFLDEIISLKNQSGELVEKSVSDWCVERKLKPRTVYGRRMKGQTWAEAFSPLKPRFAPFKQFVTTKNKR